MRAKYLTPLPLVAGLVWISGCPREQPLIPTEPATSPPAVDLSREEQQSEHVIPGEYIVVLSDDVADPGRAARALASRHGLRVRHTYRHALSGFSATIPDAAVEALRRNPNVRSVSPNRYWYIGTHELAQPTDRGTTAARAAKTRLPPKPRAPSNLRGSTVSDSEIDLTWQDNDDKRENGYEVHRYNADGTYSLIGSVAQNVTTYRDSGLSPRTGYCYKVRAIGTDNYSNFAGPVCVGTQAAAAPPTAPSSLNATTIDQQAIHLNWLDLSSDEGGFEVERCLGTSTTCTAADFIEIAQTATNVHSYDDGGLDADTDYCYRVRAFNANGDSDYTNVSCARTDATVGGNPPTAPSSLSASKIDHQGIHLNWLDLSIDEDGFRVERCQGTSTTCAPADFAEVGQSAANVSAYDDTSLAADTDYCYRVRAFNAGGESDYTNVSCARTDPPPVDEPPAAPSSLNATSVDDQAIHLNWLDLSNDEDGFKIERCQGSSTTCPSASFVEIAQGPANVSSYDDSGLAADTEYCYRVRAFNSVGDSGDSNVDCAITDAAPGGTPPAAPGNLSVTVIDHQALHLNWLDFSTNEDGFKVERCQGTSTTCTAAGFNEVAQGPANVSSYDDGGLSPSTDYCYRVRAFNSGGDSDYTNVSCARTGPAPVTDPPIAPGDLSATPLDHQRIDLTWTDNSDTEDGFAIERCQGDSTACTDAAFAQVAETGAGATTYRDGGLTAETGYCHRVRAFNAVGPSAYSNVACSVTLAAPPPGTCTDSGNHDDLAQLWNISIVKAQLNPKWQAAQGEECALQPHYYGLDSGVDTDHPDLNVVEALSFVGGGAEDENGHGTHTAGTAAAIDGNGGVVGVAPGASIHGFKVCDASGQCPEDAILAAIDEITARRLANSDVPVVANMSLGGPGTDDVMESAIRRSVNAGVVYAISAGNGWFGACWIPDNSQYHTPARVGDDDIDAAGASDGDTRRVNGAITTTASDSNDRFGNCNYGNPVTVAAPGIGVKSTWLNGGYNTLSGTSMAAPHVAGAAILYLQEYPDATPAEVEQAIMNLLDPWEPVYMPNADGRLNTEGL